MRRLLALSVTALLLAACQQGADDPASNSSHKQAAVPTNNSASAAPLTQEAKLELMHDRHENMEKIGDAMKKAGRELKGDAPDLATIRASAATIAGLAPQVKGWFPEGTGPDVGKTMAKPEIWQKPEDFALKRQDMEEAAQAFDAAAKAGDMTQIKAEFADLGKTCKACHELYRSEHKK